jgi:peptidoglycan hydrolase-like protein with peptidoglycan-binding domain
LGYADTGVPGGPPTLRKGATDAKTGGAVTRLQQQLTNAGFDVGPKGIDGVYGTDTAAAVRQVEKQYRLPTQDRGVAGTQVQAALAGNDRMRIVADTRRRFGAPLPGPSPLMGYPNVGQIPGAPPTLKGDLAARFHRFVGRLCRYEAE